MLFRVMPGVHIGRRFNLTTGADEGQRSATFAAASTADMVDLRTIPGMIGAEKDRLWGLVTNGIWGPANNDGRGYYLPTSFMSTDPIIIMPMGIVPPVDPPPPPPPPPPSGVELTTGQVFSTRLSAAIGDATKTLLMHTGTYAVGDTIWGGSGGRSENGVRIRAFGDGPVTLTGGGKKNFLYLNGDDWIIAGLPGSEVSVTGYQPADNGTFGLVGAVNGFLMEYVTVTHGNWSSSTPNNNHIFYNASTGSGQTIRNCKFLNAYSRAFQAYSGNPTMLVENCTLSSRNVTALVWDGNVTFRNVIFQNGTSGNAAYDIDAGDRVTVQTCTSQTGKGINWSAGSLTHDGSLPVDDNR